MEHSGGDDHEAQRGPELQTSSDPSTTTQRSSEILHICRLDAGLGPFVPCPDRLRLVLTAMHRAEETLMFFNRAETLCFVLRSTSEAGDALMSFDVILLYDEDEDVHGKFKHLLDMEYAALYDPEDTNYVFETFTCQETSDRSHFQDIQTSLNTLYDLKVCECYEYFVKSDDSSVCFMCALRGEPLRTTQDATCIVCSESIRTQRGCRRMACCNTLVHAACHETWRKQDINRVCMICKKGPTYPAVGDSS
jgi:hypothetical protein